MRNQPIQPKKDTRDYSVFKPAHKGPLPSKPAPVVQPAPVPTPAPVATPKV